MFFFNKQKFNDEVNKAVREQLTIQKGGVSLIEDLPHYKGNYVERQLSVTYNDMWNMYLRNEWVRACIDKITKSATNSNLYATGVDEENITPQTQERIDLINALLEDPNTGLESWKDIRKEYLRDVLIYDAGALEIVYDQNRVPAELYSLPGEKIRLNVDEHGTFKNEEQAYIITGGSLNGKTVPDVAIPRDEMIYLVNNPKSASVYGLSPLESLYQTVASDLFATKYNSDFFKNNGEASGILGAEGLTMEDLKRFRTYWKQEIAGKNHKMAIVNGKISWTPMNMTNRDMQFLEYQRWLLCKIMTVYGMQPIVLGVIDPTTGKLNSEEQLKSYREETVKPLLEMECYQLTKVLVQQAFGFNDVKITYEPIDIVNELVNSQIAVQLVGAGILTPNEARRMYFQLHEIEGGDALRGSGTDMSEAITPELNPSPKPKEPEKPKQPAEVANENTEEKVQQTIDNVEKLLKKLEKPTKSS